jgi:carotenoid cleavage dioxygenase-like enzyme
LSISVRISKYIGKNKIVPIQWQTYYEKGIRIILMIRLNIIRKVEIDDGFNFYVLNGFLGVIFHRKLVLRDTKHETNMLDGFQNLIS